MQLFLVRSLPNLLPSLYASILVSVIFLPSADEVCGGYVFTPVCKSVILFTGGVSRLWPRGCLLEGVGVQAQAWGQGVCPGGCPGPGPGVSAWGVSRPRPGGSRAGPRGVQVQAQGGVCIPACTEADPPNRRPLLWTVLILLEYIPVCP